MNNFEHDDDFQPRPLFERAGFFRKQNQNQPSHSNPPPAPQPAAAEPAELPPTPTAIPEPSPAPTAWPTDAPTAPRRGRRADPNRIPTEQIALRIPVDLLQRWRASGPGWQTRMIKLLSEHAPDQA